MVSTNEVVDRVLQRQGTMQEIEHRGWPKQTVMEAIQTSYAGLIQEAGKRSVGVRARWIRFWRYARSCWRLRAR